jgi:3-hydroxyisobutyrate dehydrogenase
MAAIAFIGLGNMGLPMARNLLRAGHQVVGYDVVASALETAAGAGVQAADSMAQATTGATCVITMLPEGRHVRDVYLGDQGILARAGLDALLIDCSTIDVDSARAVHGAALERGLEMLDAPVSGGVAGAENATLTFMVGGSEQGVARGWARRWCTLARPATARRPRSATT